MTEPARELLGQLLADEPPISAAGLARTAIRDGRRRRRRRRVVQAGVGLASAGLLFAGVQHLLVAAPTAATVPAVVASSPGPNPSPVQVTDAKQVLRSLLAARHVQVADQHGFAVGSRTPEGFPLVRGGYNTSAGGSVDVSIEHAVAWCQVSACRTLPDGRAYLVSREPVPNTSGSEVLTATVFDADRVVAVSVRTYPLTPDGKPVLSADPSPLALSESDVLALAANPLWSRAR